MDTGRNQQIDELVYKAGRRIGEDRRAFLDDACRDNPTLRSEVERRLADGDGSQSGADTATVSSVGKTAPRGVDLGVTDPSGSAPDFPTMTSAGAFRSAPAPSVTDVPQRVGRYHIRRVIASGGMGTVYEAVQDRPHRTVALKIMRSGIPSRSALRRFEYESQILARLRHTGIAQVYEAGTHADGGMSLPYFAMEYIPNAKPITAYADDHELATRERLGLFAQVCDAVQHGHQKGIIHRDLKPGNILVDSQGQVKVIDFGVARASDSDMAVTTLQTDVGQLIGTLQYMSPEQVDADPNDIDTRSDVYALGVLLFELLCRRPPYDIRKTPVYEATRIIREATPPKLSAIDRHLRGDLETIVHKALEKDRMRRYQSAAELRQDIENYLKGDRISARPPSVAYQLQVLARRHKGAFFGAAAVFVSLLLGFIVAASLYVQASRERRVAQEAKIEAEKQAKIAQAVNTFLNDDLLSAVSPDEQGIDVSMREVLDTASNAIGGRFKDDPEVEAAVRMTLGNTYLTLGAYDRSEPHLQRALDIRRALLGDEDAETLTTLNNLGVLLERRGQHEKSEKLLKDTLEKRRALLGEEDDDTLTSMLTLALTYRGEGRYDEAEDLLTRALEVRRRVNGPEDAETLSVMNNLALLYRAQGRHAEAEELLTRTLDARRRVLGEEHPATLTTMNNLAVLYKRMGRLDDAEPIYVRTLELRRKVLGEEHKFTLTSMNNLATLYSAQKRFDEAEPLHLRTLELRRRILGPEHPDTLQSMNNLALLYHDMGRLDEAEKMYEDTVALLPRVLGETHPHTITCMTNLAELYVTRGKLADADALYTRIIALSRSGMPKGHWRLGRLLGDYGALLVQMKRFDESEKTLTESYDLLSKALDAKDPRTQATIRAMADLYTAWDRPDQAGQWREKLIPPGDAASAD